MRDRSLPCLNADTWSHVLSFLSVVDVLQTRLTCKSLQRECDRWMLSRDQSHKHSHLVLYVDLQEPSDVHRLPLQCLFRQLLLPRIYFVLNGAMVNPATTQDIIHTLDSKGLSRPIELNLSFCDKTAPLYDWDMSAPVFNRIDRLVMTRWVITEEFVQVFRQIQCVYLEECAIGLDDLTGLSGSRLDDMYIDPQCHIQQGMIGPPRFPTLPTMCIFLDCVEMESHQVTGHWYFFVEDDLSATNLAFLQSIPGTLALCGAHTNWMIDSDAFGRLACSKLFLESMDLYLFPMVDVPRLTSIWSTNVAYDSSYATYSTLVEAHILQGYMTQYDISVCFPMLRVLELTWMDPDDDDQDSDTICLVGLQHLETLVLDLPDHLLADIRHNPLLTRLIMGPAIRCHVDQNPSLRRVSIQIGVLNSGHSVETQSGLASHYAIDWITPMDPSPFSNPAEFWEHAFQSQQPVIRRMHA